MFASTNLVIEIGAVIWILLGWQFFLADYVGGGILIVLMALGFVYVVPEGLAEAARENVTGDDDTVQDPVCGMEIDPDEAEHSIEHDGETHYFCSQSCKDSFDPEAANTTIREQATSWSGWRALADKQWSEWGMLWDEIAIGFVFAGLIAGFIPESVWTTVFSGETFGLPVYVVWTAILGALIGVATFVCSVGNVPFGTVLWANGLPFGAVLSYIYADLIVPPIMGRLSRVLRPAVHWRPLRDDLRHRGHHGCRHPLPLHGTRVHPAPVVGADRGSGDRARLQGRPQRASDDPVRRTLLPPPFGGQHGEPKRRGASGRLNALAIRVSRVPFASQRPPVRYRFHQRRPVRSPPVRRTPRR